MVRSFLILTFIFMFAPMGASADILFEGYSKILSGDEHIGYIISRYEFDSKKKHFISTYFLKTGKGPSEITESLYAVADAELAPISYAYTTLSGKDSKTIDAKFKGSTFIATIKSGGKVERIEKKIPKGTFLSTFLVYLMLKSKDGLRSETNYEYQAVAEEDAAIHKGQALVGKEELFNGFKVFKILNTFKDVKFLSYINERGEVLGTNALGQGITTELVANPNEATSSLPFSASILKTIFGGIPEGKVNIKSRSQNLKEAESNSPPATKQFGIPPGKNVIIKPQPENLEKKGN